MIAQLGQRLRGRQANAAGNAQPALELRAHLARPGRKIGNALQAGDKAFIDAVELLLRPQLCGQRHHAARHIAIQLEIA